MRNIGEFFSRIQNKHTSEMFKRKVIQGVVEKYTKINVPIEDISIKSSIVYLTKVSQMEKSVVFLKKEALLKEIATNLHNSFIKDIR